MRWESRAATVDDLPLPFDDCRPLVKTLRHRTFDGRSAFFLNPKATWEARKMITPRARVASYSSQSFDIFGHTAPSGMRRSSQIALALLALS
jgi:hypothetical protein